MSFHTKLQSLMEFEAFVAHVGLLNSGNYEESARAFGALEKYRVSDASNFITSSARLLRSDAPMNVKKLCLLFLNKALLADMEALCSASHEAVNGIYEAVCELLSSQDVDVIHLVSDVAVRVFLLKMERDESVELVLDLMRMLNESACDAFIYGMVGILAGISVSICLESDDQRVVLLCMVAQFSKEISAGTKCRCIEMLTNCIFLMDEVVLDKVLTLVASQTFQSDTIVACFRFWTALAHSAPETCPRINALLMKGILATVEKTSDVDIRRAILIFVREMLDSSKDVDATYLLPFIFAILRECNLALSVDDSGESNWDDAHRCLTAVVRGKPPTVMEPYVSESEAPVVRLVAIYQLTRLVVPSDSMMSFIRICLDESQPRIRYLALRCVRLLVQKYAEFHASELVPAALKHLNSDNMNIVMESHRILATVGHVLADIKPFLEILISHLSEPDCYLSNSACNCLTWLVSSLNDDKIEYLLHYVLDSYETAWSHGNGHLQTIFTTVLQSAIFRLKTDYLPYAERTLKLFLYTLNCGIPEVMLEAFTPIAVLGSNSEVDIEPLIPELMDLLMKMLRYFEGEQDVLEVATHTLYFLMTKFDLTLCIDPFVQYFCDMFHETHNFTCIAGLSDIGTTNNGFLFTRYTILINMLPTIRELWKYQPSNTMIDILDFLRVLLTFSEPNDVPTIISFTFGLLDEAQQKIVTHFQEFTPIICLLLDCAKSRPIQFTTLLQARPWLSELVTACLASPGLKDRATEILSLMQT